MMKSPTYLLTVVALAMSFVAMSPERSVLAASHRTEVCVETSEQEIASLFDRWNSSLQTGDPHKVVANYAAKSVLLPTVSNKPRLTPEDKEDYFHHFLEASHSGVLIRERSKSIATQLLTSGYTRSRSGKPVPRLRRGTPSRTSGTESNG